MKRGKACRKYILDETGYYCSYASLSPTKVYNEDNLLPVS